MKRIPDQIVQEYIALDKRIDLLNAEIEDLKQKLRKYHKRGFMHPLISFTDVKRRTIAWKLIVAELVEKYIKQPAAKKIFFARLDERFKLKPIASTIVIVGKEKKKKDEVAA
jgi:hypothetical protein